MMTIRELTADETELVDGYLPLSRLDQHAAESSTYLIAWEDDEPAGHAHIAWRKTHLGLPELQDVYVSPDHRRQGIATRLTEAAEDAARARGCARMSLGVSAESNPAARSLYERLGYRDAGAAPVRVRGVITLRGQALEVDDTLVYLQKPL